MKENQLDNLPIVFPIESYRKIMAYTDACANEITGFADIEYDAEKKCFMVGEVYLLEQTAGGTHVDMSEETVAKFNLEMVQKGKMQMPRLWWHSHVNMDVFLSPTDEGTLEELQNDSFIIALVVNKRHQMKTKGYVFARTTITMFGESLIEEEQEVIEDMPVKVQYALEDVPDDIRKEVEEKVKIHTYTYTPGKVVNWFKGQNNEREYVFNTTWGNHPSVRKILRLPKDPITAAEKMSALNLERYWDEYAEDWGYKDPATDDIWVDYWEVINGLYLNDTGLRTNERGRTDE